VPVGPDYMLAHDKQRVIIRNYEGNVFEYPELNESQGVPPSPAGAETAYSSTMNVETEHGCHCKA